MGNEPRQCIAVKRHLIFRKRAVIQLFFYFSAHSANIIRVNAAWIITTIVCVIMMFVEDVRLRIETRRNETDAGRLVGRLLSVCCLEEDMRSPSFLIGKKEWIIESRCTWREGEKVQNTGRPRCSFGTSQVGMKAAGSARANTSTVRT